MVALSATSGGSIRGVNGYTSFDSSEDAVVAVLTSHSIAHIAAFADAVEAVVLLAEVPAAVHLANITAYCPSLLIWVMQFFRQLQQELSTYY
jgi:hypothetical protein